MQPRSIQLEKLAMTRNMYFTTTDQTSKWNVHILQKLEVLQWGELKKNNQRTGNCTPKWSKFSATKKIMTQGPTSIMPAKFVVYQSWVYGISELNHVTILRESTWLWEILQPKIIFQAHSRKKICWVVELTDISFNENICYNETIKNHFLCWDSESNCGKWEVNAVEQNNSREWNKF